MIGEVCLLTNDVPKLATFGGLAAREWKEVLAELAYLMYHKSSNVSGRWRPCPSIRKSNGKNPGGMST